MTTPTDVLFSVFGTADVYVLICGETYSGKSIAAKVIYDALCRQCECKATTPSGDAEPWPLAFDRDVSDQGNIDNVIKELLQHRSLTVGLTTTPGAVFVGRMPMVYVMTDSREVNNHVLSVAHRIRQAFAAKGFDVLDDFAHMADDSSIEDVRVNIGQLCVCRDAIPTGVGS